MNRNKRDADSRAEQVERNQSVPLSAGRADKSTPPQTTGGDEGQDESGNTAGPQDATGVSSSGVRPSKNDLGVGA